MTEKIDISGLSDLFKNVHLGGAINECVLKVKESVGSIIAIDPTNQVFVHVRAKLKTTKDLVFGILDIEAMIKLFDSIKEENGIDYSIEGDKEINFKVKGRGIARFTLGKADTISTAVKEDLGKIDKIVGSKTCHTFNLTAKTIDNFEYFMGLFNSESVTLKIKGGKFRIKGGKDDTKSFDFTVAEKSNSGKEIDKNLSVSITVNGDLLHSILMLLAPQQDNPPTLSFEKGSPLIIRSGKFLWLLSPVGE